jgi:hypothetical protein
MKQPWDLDFAERGGFEPPEVLPSTVFKTAAIDHSAISPLQNYKNIQTANIPAKNPAVKFLISLRKKYPPNL